MKKSARLLVVFWLVFTVVAVTASSAWAAFDTFLNSASPAVVKYVQDHPNLATYLNNNPQVAQEVVTGAETAGQLVKRLVQVVDGFGSGYVAQHKYLARYLDSNPRVAQLLSFSWGKPGGGNGNNNFVDVPTWAQQAVNAMAAQGIIEGEGNHRFGSNQTLNRAQFATLLVREFGLLSTSSSVYAQVNFVDVPATAWYYKYVGAAAPDMTYWNEGGQAYFHPMDPADREDCMVAMVEAAGLAGEAQSVNASAVLAKFVDAGSISPNLVNLVAVAVQSGLIQGSQNKNNGNWYLSPQANLTRAQGAVLLYRALGYTKVAPGA